MEHTDMTKASAIYNFWNEFLTAYEENTVPEDAIFPYITYQFVTDSFSNDVQLTASVWYRSESWLQANAKAEEISKAIGRGGVFLDCDGGKIWLKRGTPFAQNMGDDTDNLIKRKYLNITAEFLTAD
jgi:hypothetical protein